MSLSTAPTPVRSPRTADMSRVQRRERVEVEPPPPRLGALAGTIVEHPFAPIPWLSGTPQCWQCFGWSDDYRHGQVRHG